jgi:hypothetical protein
MNLERVSAIGKEDGCAIKLAGFFVPELAALVNRRRKAILLLPPAAKI